LKPVCDYIVTLEMFIQERKKAVSYEYQYKAHFSTIVRLKREQKRKYIIIKK
jgi:hypothetical protein